MGIDIDSWPRLKISQVEGVERLRVSEVTGIEALRIGQIAPAAVHIKELNHIDPISVDSLRIDELRNIDPVRVERFDVTHLPTVNVSMSRFPSLNLNVQRVPPIAIGLQQEFSLPSRYTVHARVLGVEVARLNIHGSTTISPRDKVRREHVKAHERSFPDVAPVGNPAIPVKCVEEHSEAVTCCTPKRPPSLGPARPAVPGFRTAQRARRPAPPQRSRGVSIGRPCFDYSISAPVSEKNSGSVSWGG